MATKQKYWLLKSEPECYSIAHLAAEPNQTTYWDGVRNYQARNFMRDEMRIGDRAIFYHSNANPPSAVGTVTIVREAYPDFTAWDPHHDHYDPSSTPEAPRWFMVDVRLETIFSVPQSLEELRGMASLRGMELLRKGSRLSVQPVRKSEFDAIVASVDRSRASVDRSRRERGPR